jgi:CubicO group peptidase (beta-lactamase class C family)
MTGTKSCEFATAILMLLGGRSFVTAQPPSIQRLDGSTISLEDVDNTVLRLMTAAEVPGVAISIFNHGSVVFSKTYGLRDAEKNLPLTPDSIMAAASFSKVAFAYLVMQLVEEGTLDLDKPVASWLPRPLPDYTAYHDLASDPRYKKITPRMLLSHTSGFPNFRWLNSDLKLNINFDPGSKYAYSGEGIQLLQLLVETVTNKPLGALMEERVFRPLGMSRSSMISEDRFAADSANGYDEWGRSLGPQQPKQATAAGSMQTTLADFTKFMQAVIESKGLRKSTRDLMLSPQIPILSKHQFPTLDPAVTDANKSIALSYGLGWGLYTTRYGKAFFKEGHAEGFRNYTVVFDKPKDGIVIMTNSSNGEGIFKYLLDKLLANTFTPIEWEGYTPYDELPARKALPVHTEVTVAANLLDRLAGRYSPSPELVLVLTRVDGHLQLKENDGAPDDLFPDSELRFFSKTADDVVTFDLDASGKVTRLVIHTGGRDIPVKRVE